MPWLERIFTRERWKSGEALTRYQQMRVDLSSQAIAAEKAAFEVAAAEARRQGETEELTWGPEVTADSGRKVYQDLALKLHMNAADIYTLIVSPR